jgi:hypothetical protein
VSRPLCLLSRHPLDSDDVQTAADIHSIAFTGTGIVSLHPVSLNFFFTLFFRIVIGWPFFTNQDTLRETGQQDNGTLSKI